MRSCSFSSFESSSGPGSAAETETETNCDFKQEEQEHNTNNKHHQVSEEKEVIHIKCHTNNNSNLGSVIQGFSVGLHMLFYAIFLLQSTKLERYRPVHVLLSRFYLDFILILSKFYPDEIRIEFR